MTSEFTVAVHALVFLNHRQSTQSSEAVAENVCTNPARVRKVLSCLKKAGLVETKDGIDGGYHFTGNAEAVSLRMVADALNAAFVSASWRSGNPDMDCLIASGMDGVMSSIYRELDESCRVRLEQISIADIDRQIFTGKCAEQRRADA